MNAVKVVKLVVAAGKLFQTVTTRWAKKCLRVMFQHEFKLVSSRAAVFADCKKVAANIRQPKNEFVSRYKIGA